MSSTTSRRFWETQAQTLARRINVAAWVARAAPAAFFVASVAAVVAFALRRARQPLDFFWLALAGALALTGGVAWALARRHFFSPDDARVLLEAKLKLDTCLTAAALGLLPWPDPRRDLPAVVEWRGRAPLGWLGGALAVLLAALFSPVPARSGAGLSGPPPSLLRTQEMIATLKQHEVVDPSAIEQLEERVAELARRSSDEQYSHSGLEAADALRDQTAAAAAKLARELDSAASALRSANSERELKSSAGRLSAALTGLREGEMPAHENILSRLPGAEADLGKLTPQQREQLAQALAQAAQCAGGVAGAAGAGAPMAEPDPNGQPARYGSGEPGGGGESAPLMLNPDRSDAGPGHAQALSGDALQRFALGDKLGATTGAHQVDPEKAAAPSSAGAIASPAAGGEAVWVNRLTPTERRALKEFFK